MKTQVKILSLLAVVMLAVTGCTSTTTTTPTTAPTDAPAATTAPDTDATPEPESKVFTIAELETYNGKDGAKAYVAVDGMVYDVTNVTGWSDGVYEDLEAGKDLTDAIKDQIDKGNDVLEGATVVGTLGQ